MENKSAQIEWDYDRVTTLGNMSLVTQTAKLSIKQNMGLTSALVFFGDTFTLLSFYLAFFIAGE